MPIVLAPENKEFTIIKVLTNDDVKKHLENLGIIVGSKILVVSNNGGSVVCQVKNEKIALDTDTAKKIFVA